MNATIAKFRTLPLWALIGAAAVVMVSLASVATLSVSTVTTQLLSFCGEGAGTSLGAADCFAAHVEVATNARTLVTTSALLAIHRSCCRCMVDPS